MQIDVTDTSKNKVGEAELLPSVFEAEIKTHLIYDVVVSQMASRRAGTQKAKLRNEVRGGGKKPWKQKGTGRARAGSIRSPLFAGGGVVFAPRPRSYAYEIPKKARKSALISALSSRVKENAVTVIDKIAFDEPKTKVAQAMLATMGLGGKTLFVIADKDVNVELSFRNIPSVKTIRSGGLNVYDILDANNVVFTKDALDRIQERLGQ